MRRFERDLDDYHAIMVKAIADRLAEAFAEYLHAQARKDWGYGEAEQLSNEELIAEKYRGIRPAYGYPACPDHSEKFKLFELLDASRQGITLTESGAMLPAASVSGLYFSHPAGEVLQRRPDRPRSARGLREAQGRGGRGGRALAGAESGVRSGGACDTVLIAQRRSVGRSRRHGFTTATAFRLKAKPRVQGLWRGVSRKLRKASRTAELDQRCQTGGKDQPRPCPNRLMTRMTMPCGPGESQPGRCSSP